MLLSQNRRLRNHSKDRINNNTHEIKFLQIKDQGYFQISPHFLFKKNILEKNNLI